MHNQYDDTFEHRGHTFRVEFPRDDSQNEPWKEYDGHGIVSEWTTRGKCPGERILVSDRSHHRYYDAQATMRLAIKDQWGIVHCKVCGEASGGLGTSLYGAVHQYGPVAHEFTPESRKQTAARAVDRDFEFLRGWCNDEWTYVGVVVTLADEDDDRDETASLWGIESNAGDYLVTVAHELADEILSRIEVDEPRAQLSEN